MTAPDDDLAALASSAGREAVEAFDAAGEFVKGERIPGTPYTVVRRIGRGGHAAVYHCQNDIGRHVAVKVILHHLARRAELMERMVEEARRMVRLRHPNIVEVYNAGITTGARPLAYIEMELLSGSTGRALLGRKVRVPVPHALDILGDIASALQKAHQNGVVHQDLKPDNIFIHVDEDQPCKPVTKLLDFGVSKVLHEADGGSASRLRAATSAGAPRPAPADSLFEGTLAYAAPEQLRGDAITAQTDLYALGVLAFEMVSGSRPFEKAEARDRAEHEHLSLAACDELGLSRHLVEAILHAPTPRLCDFTEALVPREFDVLVTELLQRDPAKRPVSALNIGNRLRALRNLKGLEKSHVTTEELLLQAVKTAKPRGKEPMLGMDVGSEAPPRPPVLAELAAIPDVPRPRAAVEVDPPPVAPTTPSREGAEGRVLLQDERARSAYQARTEPLLARSVVAALPPGVAAAGGSRQAGIGTFDPLEGAARRQGRAQRRRAGPVLPVVMACVALAAVAAVGIAGAWRWAETRAPKPQAAAAPALSLRPLPPDPEPALPVGPRVAEVPAPSPPGAAAGAPLSGTAPSVASALATRAASPPSRHAPVPPRGASPMHTDFHVESEDAPAAAPSRPDVPNVTFGAEPPPRPVAKSTPKPPPRRPPAPSASARDDLLDWLDRPAKPKSGL